MKAPRLGIGISDPISYSCSCSAKDVGGSVLLFYRYWTNNPRLPPECLEKADGASALAQWHTDLTEKFHLTGKIRIAKEGFNITIAGTNPEIDEYIKACINHWSFQGIPLTTEEERQKFFKPTDGCACVFGGPSQAASVRVTSEITPMGVEGYVPSEWDKVESLSPEDFHRKCHEDSETLLIDVRNHYESKIGYFVNPWTGLPAVRPPIRRFSQWPQFVKHRLMKDVAMSSSVSGPGNGNSTMPKQIMTYCTGGIRCEKGVRFMQEQLPQQGEKVYTLHGGIAAYLTWMDEEINQGRKQPSESLFRGRNYVFDARGSTGLSVETEPVSYCHKCGVASDNLSKCQSKGCHLILVVCHNCEGEGVRCCESCTDSDSLLQSSEGTEKPRSRPMCDCERIREMELWGGERVQSSKVLRVRPKKRSEKPQGWRDGIDIRVKTIE